MIGGLVLEHCLNNDEISSVISLSRNSTNIKHEKLTEILIDDFLELDEFNEHFKNLDIVYYCLGVYTGAVDRATFRKITVDYTRSIADKVAQFSPDTNFCFLSGAGADRTEKSSVMFAKDKGTAENYLLNSSITNIFIFRPAYIYPVKPRKEPNFGYKFYRWIYPVVKLIYPNGAVTSVHLAQVMYTVGITGDGRSTFENRNIRHYQLSESA